MRILYVHNEYAKPSGEEHAASAIAALLQEHGHEVEFFRRSSAELGDGFYGKVKAFLAGIWNPWAAAALGRRLDEYQPDLVQIQNLYPLLSPSIFKPIKVRGIPVVMRCPNYRLFCPNGLCLDASGRVCEDCFGGREWHCALKNCAGGRFKSIGYALRGYAARVSRRILDHVDMFIVQTEFQRQKFIGEEIPAERLGIVPGIMQKMQPAEVWESGQYVTYIGRVSPEKGIEDFLECARLLPDLPFMVAGSYEGMPGIRDSAPANVTWQGFLKGDALRQAYLDARMVVVPSRCYEGFPNVIVQGMQMERPIIAANIGAPATIIQERVNGLLYEPGNVEELSRKVAELYDNQAQAQKYGVAGHNDAERLYSRETVYKALSEIYDKAKEFSGQKTSDSQRRKQG